LHKPCIAFWPILYKNWRMDPASVIPRSSTAFPEPCPHPGPVMKAPLPLLVSGLGIAQIVSWGSLYYPISVLGDSMRHDLGVSATVLFAAFTLSLLISGMAAPLVARLMEAHGARTVLCAGSLLGMAALLLLARASGPAGLFAAALVAGVAMAACLYDAAFMALNQLAGDAYRRSVTGLTLFGGFASTVSWPLSQLLLGELGWRQTLLIYAGAQLVLCLPLHALLLPAHSRSANAAPDASAPAVVLPDTLWLAIAFALASFVLSVLSVHLIKLFRLGGLDAGSAVFIATLVGPMQVLGRLLELGAGGRLRAIHVGSVAFASMLLALVGLFLLHGTTPLAFAVAGLYGISNGLMTIVRGVVPAELYGRRHYGLLLGRLARPAFVARALAPFAFPLGLAGLGTGGAILALGAIAMLACWSYRAALRHAGKVVSPASA
jgi:predicted MFS family arabinose efflux permease